MTWIQHFYVLHWVIAQPLIQLQAFPQQNYYLAENLTRLNFVKPKLSTIINEQEQKFKDFNNHSKNLKLFYLGDHVWVSDYGKILSNWVDGKIIEKIGNVMYKIQLKCSPMVVKHIDQLHYKPHTDYSIWKTTACSNHTPRHEIQRL